MTDTDTIEPGTTEEQAAEVAAMEPAPETPAAPKPPKTHACLCQSFEVRGATEDEVFSTGCEQTTQSKFAQGHDARLVSFLVDGYFDKYTLWQVVDGKDYQFGTPGEAAARASDALAEKARKATERRGVQLTEKDAKAKAREAAKQEKAAAKEKAKAEKAAAKDAPKATGAEVVEGSREGDVVELREGQAKIKVGRFEYVATIDDAGVATYTDGKGEVQTRERDGYKLLAS